MTRAKPSFPGRDMLVQVLGIMTLRLIRCKTQYSSMSGDRNGSFSVTFSQVENGDYIYLGGGRYQFVGKGQGNYQPVRMLPLPEAAQVTVVRIGDCCESFIAFVERGRAFRLRSQSIFLHWRR